MLTSAALAETDTACREAQAQVGIEEAERIAEEGYAYQDPRR